MNTNENGIRYSETVLPYIKDSRPENIENPVEHRNLLESAGAAFPELKTVLQSDDESDQFIKKLEHRELLTSIGYTRFAYKVNAALEQTNISENLLNASNDSLIAAFFLLEYYSNVLISEKSVAVTKVLDMVSKVILNRFEDNQNLQPEPPQIQIEKPQSEPPQVQIEKTPPESSQTQLQMPLTVKKSRIDGAYSSSLDEGIEYVIVYNKNSGEYILEIYDTTSRLIGDRNFAPGKTAKAVFLLTDDEFNLTKAPDRNREKLDDFAKKLAKCLPHDRFKSSEYVDNANNKSELRLSSRCPTIDNDKYSKYISQKTAQKVRSLSRVYVIYLENLGLEYPLIDNRGFAWIAGSESYVVTLQNKNPHLKLAYFVMSVEEFNRYVYDWCRIGVTRFRFKDQGGECGRNEYLEPFYSGRRDFYNADLNYFILRIRQCYEFPQSAEIFNAITTWTKLLYENLPHRVFLVPVSFDGMTSNKEDFTVHYNDESYQMLNTICANEKLKGYLDYKSSASPIKPLGENGEPLIFGDTEIFFDSTKYRLANAGDFSQGKTMHIRTVGAGKELYIGAFTDFKALNHVFKGKVHIALFTYEQLIQHVSNSFGSGSRISGIVINPGTLSFILKSNDVQNVEQFKHNAEVKKQRRNTPKNEQVLFDLGEDI